MKSTLVCSVLLLAVAAHAKLPAPVMTDEAKAKAAEAAAKTAHGNKVAAYKLCLAQNQAASSYFKTMAASGKTAKPATETPPCADPGPFMAPAAASPAPASAPAAAPKA